MSGLSYGTEYKAKSLVGNIKESINDDTRHHFSMKEGETLERIDYAEAARWIVFLNAYGVSMHTGKKVVGTGLSVGVGRLGQLGLVMVNGATLFQILMLNLCPLKDNSDIWGKPKPVWEQGIHIEQGRKIAPPDNLPELYTMQSRRILLKRENGVVIGFRATGGDFYPTENDFNEPMTLWREKKSGKKAEQITYIPKIHTPTIQVWEEFPALACMERSGHLPGIVRWIEVLSKAKTVVSRKLVTFKMIGTVYGDKMKYTYGDSIDNALTLSSELLADIGKEWITLISDEVEKCQNVVAKVISPFSSSMGKLLGGEGANAKDVGTNVKDTLISNYYFHINSAFREWLVGIDPAQGEREDKMIQWEQRSYRYARQTVEDYIRIKNINIYAHKKEKGKLLTVSSALNDYMSELRKIYPQISESG